MGANFSTLEIVARSVSGTYTTLDLLQANKSKAGIGLLEWKPALPGLKGGGVYQSSSLTDGQQLVGSNYDNAFEKLNLIIAAATQDDVIGYERTLQALLIQARNYWTASFQDTVVFLKARSAHESYTRYALVMNYALNDEGVTNPYAQPFFSACGSIMNELSLVIERGDWFDVEPGLSSAVSISSPAIYTDPVGQGASTNEHFVQNADQRMWLTHIYRYDNSGGSFSANLLSAALPYALLPDPPDVDDCLYIGSDSNYAFASTFGNVVFNIGTPAGSLTASWQYFTSNWVNFPADQINDNTDALDTSGIHALCFTRPPDWQPTVVNGVTAYWIRLHVSAVAVAVAPVQIADLPFTANRACVNVAQGLIKGDIPAFARIKVRNYSCENLTEVDSVLNRVIWGSRSLSRGAYFTPFLTATDGYPTSLGGVLVTSSVPNLAFYANTRNITARCAAYTPTGIEPLGLRMYWTIQSIAAPSYVGRYHAYARVEQAGGAANDYTMQLRCGLQALPGGTSTETVSIGAIRSGILPSGSLMAAVGLVDLGIITIPATDSLNTQDQVHSINVQLHIGHAVATVSSLWIYDVVLIPVDEFFGISYNSDAANEIVYLDHLTYLDIDSTSYPKNRKRAVMRAFSDDMIWSTYTTLVADQARLQPNAEQNIWFLFSGTMYPQYIPTSVPSVVCSIQLYSASRYLGMRGAT